MAHYCFTWAIDVAHMVVNPMVLAQVISMFFVPFKLTLSINYRLTIA